MAKNINMALKSVYFDSINRGTKTTEYRDMTDYYIDKLVDKSHYEGMSNEEIKQHLIKGGRLYWVKYDTITFHNNGRVLKMRINDIAVYEHHNTFAIKLGKRIS